MGDMWIRDVEITSLIAISSVLVVLPIQLLLCFKVKPVFLRLLPTILLTATTVFLFAMMTTSRDWDAIGYAVLGVFSGEDMAKLASRHADVAAGVSEIVAGNIDGAMNKYSK